MRVKAIRDHFGADGHLRKAGEEFDYHEDELHEHIKPVKAAAPAETEELEEPITRRRKPKAAEEPVQ